ncbi:hypothetical protein [Pseudoxanthomonas sp. PXM02]|uniref:hypothetical protein n=1 Tax=Pseudoxanthomonas sp. PXM02 TaxID=2769294 RepID=UPI0017834B0B|nr:hypothetical protein [Pseudoxanthomonas sp. PXM02]MBD9478916.1 hypothetical protein [Pseudoxanthomonas sp. PXM02]
MKLPDDFQWVEAAPDDDWSGARLDLDGHPVLEVSACRGGWLVVVLMDDPRQPQANVAVRSVPAGMRWSARWALARTDRLRVLAARRNAPRHLGEARPSPALSLVSRPRPYAREEEPLDA